MISADKLASCFPAPTPQPQPAGNSVGGRGIAASPEALRTYLESSGVKVADTKHSAGDTVFVLECCPANPEHGTDRAAAVIWSAGKIGFKCHHDRCSGITWKQVRAKIDPGFHGHDRDRSDNQPTESTLPEVTLPGGDVSICEAGGQLGRLLDSRLRLFMRGRVVFGMAQDEQSRTILEPTKPAELASILETVAQLRRLDKKGIPIPATCNETTAKLLLHTEDFRGQLPPLRLITNCPVLFERDGHLAQISGYDRGSGIFAQGDRVPDLLLPEAVACLADLFPDFHFASESDRSRAFAALITPALVFSGLLRGRPPVDLGEANESQAGKGFRNKITAAIYKSTVKCVTQRRNGVGGMEESFDSALIHGATFISLDNLRGKIDSPRLESFLTEDLYIARSAYTVNVEIDPRRVIIMMTSNKAEITPDLANRSSIVRILKQPADYVFRQYAEGNLLDHVRANQPRFLGAVFTVVRAWHQAGMPRNQTVGHDFRDWAGALDYIVQRILGLAPLLDGHRQVQARVASPALAWLRDVAMAVSRAGRLGVALRPHELFEFITDAGIEVPGLAEGADLSSDEVRQKGFRAIGQRLGTYFREGKPVLVDYYQVERQESMDQAGRNQRAYVFFSVSRIFPNVPECVPESFCLFPESPESKQNTLLPAQTQTIEMFGSHSGDSGDSGKRVGDSGNSGGHSGNSAAEMEVHDL